MMNGGTSGILYDQSVVRGHDTAEAQSMYLPSVAVIMRTRPPIKRNAHIAMVMFVRLFAALFLCFVNQASDSKLPSDLLF